MIKTILAFGAHPDDVEIGCAGTLAKESHLGNRVIIVDLTAGEMGTNGTPEIRIGEAEKAAQTLGAEKRINLHMADRRIKIDDDHIRQVALEIRRWKPDIILLPYYQDRHPDHEQASRLIKEAIFDAGCTKLIMDEFDAHKVSKVLYYYINDVDSANLYLDISEYVAFKKSALMCHESQFVLSDERAETVLNRGYVDRVMSRDTYYGHLNGTTAAEAFRLEKPILLERI